MKYFIILLLLTGCVTNYETRKTMQTLKEQDKSEENLKIKQQYYKQDGQKPRAEQIRKGI